MHMTIAIIIVIDSAIIIAITTIGITVVIIIIRTIITYTSKYIIRYNIAIITFLDKTLLNTPSFH